MFNETPQCHPQSYREVLREHITWREKGEGGELPKNHSDACKSLPEMIKALNKGLDDILSIGTPRPEMRHLIPQRDKCSYEHCFIMFAMLPFMPPSAHCPPHPHPDIPWKAPRKAQMTPGLQALITSVAEVHNGPQRCPCVIGT